ncbi:hypothetical protein IJQ19_03895 [bacterium]|nr:hypothetical protein [bacterium]
MTKITKENIKNYADKLLFDLNDKECDLILHDFDDVVKLCHTILHVPGLEKTKPMTHCLDNFIVKLREDKTLPSVEIDKLLANCDVSTEREVEIPKVVE